MTRLGAASYGCEIDRAPISPTCGRCYSLQYCAHVSGDNPIGFYVRQFLQG